MRIEARVSLLAVRRVRSAECLSGGEPVPSAEEVYGEARRNAITFAKGRPTRGKRDEGDDRRTCGRRTVQSLGASERAIDIRVRLSCNGDRRMSRWLHPVDQPDDEVAV